MARLQIFFDPKEGMTHQSFKKDCDIQNIMKQYKRTGFVNHITSAKEIMGDFTEALDYHSSLNVVLNAQEAFDNLPAKVRSYYSNDPGNFLDDMSINSTDVLLNKFNDILTLDRSVTAPDGDAKLSDS